MIDIILGALCEVRSAEHAAAHGQTVAADSRYHVMNGELPTCGVEDQSPTQVASRDEYKDDGKSRYCRKRWFC